MNEKTLRDALANQRKQSLAEVLPLTCEMIINTDNYRTFKLAGDVLDRTWVRMSPIHQYWRFEHVVYNLFWPRIGSIENIEKQLKKPYEDGIFWDSMSWIRSIKNIGHYNHKLYKYFEEISHLSESELAKLPRELKGRAVDIKNRKLTPAESVGNTLDDFYMEDITIELPYSCYNIESARIMMDEIVRPGGRIDAKDGALCINNFLKSNRSKRVRLYVLRRLLSERFFYDEKDYVSFIVSATEGIQSDSELEIIKTMSKSLASSHPELKEAPKTARDNLAAEKFQRETIRKSPIVKEVIRTYGRRQRN